MNSNKDPDIKVREVTNTILIGVLGWQGICQCNKAKNILSFLCDLANRSQSIR